MEFYWSKLLLLVETLKIIKEKKKTDLADVLNSVLQFGSRFKTPFSKSSGQADIKTRITASYRYTTFCMSVKLSLFANYCFTGLREIWNF